VYSQVDLLSCRAISGFASPFFPDLSAGSDHLRKGQREHWTESSVVRAEGFSGLSETLAGGNGAGVDGKRLFGVLPTLPQRTKQGWGNREAWMGTLEFLFLSLGWANFLAAHGIT
jgi:hypothetical protein